MLAFGWIALLASASVHASWLNVDMEKEREIERGLTFRNYVESQHFSLRLEFNDSGRVAVRKKFLGPDSKEDLICQDKPRDGGIDFLAQARFDLYFVEQCLLTEMPELNLNAIYEQALHDVQAQLDARDLTSQYDLTQADLLQLEPWAQASLNRLLKRQDVPDLLVGAWKRHASCRSECYQAKVREMSDLHKGKDSALCDRWPRLVGTIRFCGPDPANLIYYTPTVQDSREQRAIDSLEQLGLRACLGNLVTQAGEPRVIDSLQSLGDYLPWTVQERANEYAWEIWKSAHVDVWLDRTLEAGRVPEDVAAALNACAHGARLSGARSPRVVSERSAQRRLPPRGWNEWDWENREPTPTEALLEDRYTKFLTYAGDFWVADVTLGVDGILRVAPYLNGPHDDQDLFCQPTPRKDVIDFFSTARLELPIVLACLHADIPALDVSALHEAGAAHAASVLKEWLRRRTEGTPAPEILELQTLADSQVVDSLQKSGVFEFLSAAVRRHVGRNSECYRDGMSGFERRRQAYFAAGGTCEAPEQLIQLSPRMKPDLLNSVDFSLGSFAAGPFQAAIEKLQEPGLRLCLGQILEQAGDRTTMEKLGILQQYPRFFRLDRAVGYAWDLWRKHGLEDWIERTTKAGRVPRHVREVIQKCAAGEIPDLVQRSRDR